MADPFATAVDEDPAADFLAREQQELAGLEDDGFGALTTESAATVEVSQENPAVSEDGLDLFGGEVISSTNSVPVQDFFGDTDFTSEDADALLDSFSPPPTSGEANETTAPADSFAAPTSADDNGADELLDALTAPNSEEVTGTDVLLDALAAPKSEEVNGTDVVLDPLAAPKSEEINGADALLDVFAAPTSGEVNEADVIFDTYDVPTLASIEVNGSESPSESELQPTQRTLLWREEQLKKIAEKDKNEEAKLEELRNTAKRELEEWYARQAEQVEKHKKNNRVAEAEFVKERDETTPGNEWERISRLCDFNPKNNKNTKDVSKLRSLLLQLKQNPLSRTTTT